MKVDVLHFQTPQNKKQIVFTRSCWLLSQIACLPYVVEIDFSVKETVEEGS